jgi:hypothetical protein
MSTGAGNILAAPNWIPADLAGKLSATPASPTDDSIKNILVPDYESRIAKLDTSIPFIKRHLIQLQDNVVLLYRQYNRSYNWGGVKGFAALLEDMTFYLPRLEAKTDPDNDLFCIKMNKAYWDGSVLQSYWVMIPRTYSSKKSAPVICAFQMESAFVDNFQRNVTNTEFVAVGVFDKRVLWDLATDLNIDPFRIYVTGHSQGGHISMRTAWNYPGDIAACMPMSPDLRLPNQWHYFYNVRGLKNVPVCIGQGLYDGYIDGTLQVYNVMREFGCPVEFNEFYAEHSSIVFQDPAQFPMITSFFKQHVLNPYPKTVYHVVESGDPAYSRAFWVEGKLAYKRGVEGTDFNPWFQVSADKASNTVTIDSSDAVFTAFDFYLSDSLVDMKKPVTVIRNGKNLYTGAVSSDGKVSVVLATNYVIAATPSTKRSVIPAEQLSSGVTKALWQNLDSIRCLVFGACDGKVPQSAIKVGASLQRAPGNQIICTNRNGSSIVIGLSGAGARQQSISSVRVFDMRGRRIADLAVPRSSTSVVWDAPARAGGTYVIEVRLGENVVSGRVSLMQ